MINLPPNHRPNQCNIELLCCYCCRLEACELTGACCEDLASTFTQCRTLWGINLLNNTLDYTGLVVLCEALRQQKCTPHVLG